jgi:hypothetical protein
VASRGLKGTFPVDCAGSGDGGGKPQVGLLLRRPLTFGFRVRVSTSTVSIRFEIEILFLSFPKQDLLPSTALVPLIDLPDRLGVDQVG